jgi:hypothetical protein
LRRCVAADEERCPPKAEVVSSNLAGSANYFNYLANLWISTDASSVSAG